ncbi:TPA: hypothetical protein N0F65_011604 [Lagenidium giganteum]|uniref:Uncharacterized protein n=1 Tax=Lagenidium giganteum TaxID=4803 RepID=A0AAV2ZFM6_9STRA|nr:TPA: hypothetical protein N0F65_011604 [Lagenidium giganteum]
MAAAERRHEQLPKQAPALPTPRPEDDDEEVDETFLALQNLLVSMNLARGNKEGTSGHTQNSSNMPATTAAVSNEGTQRRPSQEELLETRRQERERFRHFILSKGQRSSSRRRCPAYYHVDDEDDEDDSRVSVESAISNRLINGSFSRFNVHVISRDRWSKEEEEPLPIVLLPKDPKLVSPADNPKLNVNFTGEFVELREKLEASEAREQTRFLTPPRRTWYIQMRDFDAVEC